MVAWKIVKKLSGDATNYAYDAWPTQNVLDSGLINQSAVSYANFKGLRKMNAGDLIILVTDRALEATQFVNVNGHFYFGQ